MSKTNNKAKERLKIYIDNREKVEKVYHMFDKQPYYKVEVQKLELGDILFDSCCVERKSFSDFLSSVSKERFWINMDDMKKQFKYCCVWIDGSDADLMDALAYSCKRGYKYGYAKYNGALARLFEMQIPVLKFDKIENATDFFMTVFKKIETDTDSSVPIGIKKSGIPIDNRRIQAISRTEGIGPNTAKFLLDQYGTIENLIKESKKKEGKIMTSICHFFCEKSIGKQNV